MPRADATERLRRNRLILPRSNTGAGGTFSSQRQIKRTYFFGELPSGGPGLQTAKARPAASAGRLELAFPDGILVSAYTSEYPIPHSSRAPGLNLKTRLGNSLRRSQEKNVTHYTTLSILGVALFIRALAQNPRMLASLSFLFLALAVLWWIWSHIPKWFRTAIYKMLRRKQDGGRRRGGE